MGRLGAHVSVAGGTPKAFERGRDLGCDALQIFVKNANRWSGKVISDDEAAAFRAQFDEAGLPVIAHAAYLINLGSPKREVAHKSVDALTDELQRCTRLGVSGLVLHPGAHLGEGEEEALDRIARSLDAIYAEHPDLTAKVLLENTAGQGSTLGADVAELGAIVERCDAASRLAVCVDSCHAFAAGYDLRQAQGYEALLEALDRAVGLGRVEAWHLNDSQHPLGSRKDRHANIGDGAIGEGFFARVVHDERFASLPMILETPLGDDGEGHRRDLDRLRAL